MPNSQFLLIMQIDKKSNYIATHTQFQRGELPNIIELCIKADVEGRDWFVRDAAGSFDSPQSISYSSVLQMNKAIVEAREKNLNSLDAG